WRALLEAGYLTKDDCLDFLTWLLRQLGRHLTAYDLVRFHHRGANYPDALLLDAVLKTAFSLVENYPDLCMPGPGESPQEAAKRRRRGRGLRQGWLHHRALEGLPVPDAPTSPGENARVLPCPRVPEEQLVTPATRSRRLYAGDPLVPGARLLAVLHESV